MAIKFPGLAERIRERFRALDYWNTRTDREDVRRFCMEHRGYLSQSLYEWLKGATPEYESLVRLARDLEVPLAWLLLGEGPAPAGVAAASRRQEARAEVPHQRRARRRARG